MQSAHRSMQPGDDGMMSEDDYVFGEDDDEVADAGDSLAMRHVILSDVMASYDLGFILDVRDEMFMSRLSEAAGVLGIGIHMHVAPAEGAGDGISRSSAVLELSYRGETETYSADSMCAASDDAALMAARRVLVSAGLLNEPEPVGRRGFEFHTPAASARRSRQKTSMMRPTAGIALNLLPDGPCSSGTVHPPHRRRAFFIGSALTGYAWVRQ